MLIIPVYLFFFKIKKVKFLTVNAANLLLNVLQQEWRSPQVIHRESKEALDLFLVQIHGDYMSQT